MFESILKFLGIKESRSFDEYLELEKSLQEVYKDTEVLASIHYEFIKSLEASKDTSIYDEIRRKADSFEESYIPSLVNLNAKRREILKSIDSLKKTSLVSEINSHLRKREYNNLILSFQKGLYSEDKFHDLMKAMTGSKTKYADILVFNQRGELLLLQRSSTDPSNAMKWGVPGGHVDYGEDCLTAAKRELLEETGIKKSEYLSQVGEYEDDKVHIKYYRTYCQDPLILLDNEEHHDYKWIDVRDIDDYEMPFNMAQNLKKIINPIHEQVTKIKKSLENGEINRDQFVNLTSLLLKKKEYILSKALSNEQKERVADYVLNYEGEFDDIKFHEHFQELGINYEQAEEYLFELAKKQLENE